VCYYSSISVGFKIIEDRFGARFVQTESFKPVYSACGFSFLLCPLLPMKIVGLSACFDGDSFLSGQGLRDSLAMRQRTLNARSETVFEKPAFRYSIMSKRCLILVDGFFEWRHEQKGVPLLHQAEESGSFCLGGHLGHVEEPENRDELKTYAVLTTNANQLLEKIHNRQKRMPVILPRENERTWLQNDLERGEIQALLQPYNTDEMEAYPVSGMVNKLGLNTDNPEVARGKIIQTCLRPKYGR